MQRRQFLKFLGLGSSLAIAGPNSAREPIERLGPPRFHFGLAAYSLRDYFAVSKGKAKKPAADGPEIDMFGFVDYCAKHGFDSAELTSYFFPADLDDDYLLRLKRHAFERGVTICGTAIGNDFTVGIRVRNWTPKSKRRRVWIDRADVMGAPHIRFFAGTAAQLTQYPARMDEAIEAIEKCAEHAGSKGIYLGIENHGRLTGEQILEIMEKITSPWVGVNLDTGNFISEDPYADLTACAPFAVNVQVKAMMKSPDGKNYEADFDRIAKILRVTNYQGNVVLEYEEAKPYDNIPITLARLQHSLAKQQN